MRLTNIHFSELQAIIMLAICFLKTLYSRGCCLCVFGAYVETLCFLLVNVGIIPDFFSKKNAETKALLKINDREVVVITK